jgi:hypothetical protein
LEALVQNVQPRMQTTLSADSLRYFARSTHQSLCINRLLANTSQRRSATAAAYSGEFAKFCSAALMHWKKGSSQRRDAVVYKSEVPLLLRLPSKKPKDQGSRTIRPGDAVHKQNDKPPQKPTTASHHSLICYRESILPRSSRSATTGVEASTNSVQVG